MDIKLLTKEQDTIRFVLSDVSPAFANALRRIILAEVPVMAIEDVMILENSSVMYDEILAHRLGLIPITTDQSYNLPEECTCKSELGCDKVPIVKLAQGQRIKLEAYARLGRGRDHAKWQPASACTYSYDPKAKTFNFFVDSTGTLPPEKLVLDAARLISAKTLGFEEALGGISEK